MESGEGRDAHTVVNPVTASGIAEVPYATKADLEEALAAADRAWPEWRSTDVEKRGAILHKAARCCASGSTISARSMTQEQGKILAEAKAEVLGSAQLFDWYAEEIKRDYGRTLVRPAGQLVAGDPPAGRPDRDLHAVEFPDLSARQEGRGRARRRLHRHLAPAARNAGLRDRAVPLRWPMPASPRASPSWSMAMPT